MIDDGTRPKVFLSATTGDLGSHRADLGKVIGLHWEPVLMTAWPAQSYQELRAMLRSKLEPCQAAIHVVGRCFGSEPPAERDMPRRSFTQLEFEIARELQAQRKLSLYVFMCSDDFPYDDHPLEPVELARLQKEYRSSFERSGFATEVVRTRKDLAIAALSIEPGEVWEGWDLVSGLWTHKGIAGLAYSLEFVRTGLNAYELHEYFFGVRQGYGRATLKDGALEFRGRNWMAGRYGGKLWTRRGDVTNQPYLEGHVQWETLLFDFYFGRELKLRRCGDTL